MGNKIIKSIISYTLLTSLFLTGSGWQTDGLVVYWYYPFYILIALYGLIVFHRIHKGIAVACLFIMAYAITSAQFGFDGLMYSLKQVLNLFFHTFVFYTFLQHEDYNFEAIFTKYIRVCKIVLLLGFFQIAFWQLGYSELFLLAFPYLRDTNISIRFQSIMQEPAIIGLLFTPVIFLSIRNLFSRKSLLMGKGWSMAFIIAYLLTFSLVAYIGLAAALLVFHFRLTPWRRVFTSVVVVTVIMALLFASYAFIPSLKLRIDDSIAGIANDFTKEEVFKSSNLSTYAALSNLHVTKRSLRENPVLGVGLGSYLLAYERYLPDNMKSYSSLNNQDGSSMALRLLTETGMIGAAFFMFFLFRHKAGFNTSFLRHDEILWIINAGIFVMIILFLLRNGNYTINGKILFLLLYYLTNREAANQKIVRSNIQLNPALHDAD